VQLPWPFFITIAKIKSPQIFFQVLLVTIKKLSNAKKEQLVYMNLKVPKGLRDSFKAKVASEGKKMLPVLIEYMKNYVKK
jgi:hypothetical protein